MKLTNQTTSTAVASPNRDTYIVTLHGEPVTRIIQESDGKPNVHTGSREDAIEYTEAEAAEVVAWIGAGAEAEQQAEPANVRPAMTVADRLECFERQRADALGQPATDAKLVPIVGCDFIDTRGERTTQVQFCRHSSAGKFEAVAIVGFCGEATTCRAVDALNGRERGLVRLALRYQARSTPQRFTEKGAR